MAVTQYIGARYVPLFADPIDWDNTKHYEPLTIVYHQGNSFTSKQFVPTGIDIANTDYWALTGNYNAQIEQYRREIQAFDGRITANAQAIADEVTARMTEDTAIRGIITDLQGKLSDIRDYAAPWSSVSMCFLGDSITHGDLTSSGGQVETPWPSAMCNQLGVTDFNNAAVGGATAASGTPASSNALSQARSLTRSYDYIFLMFGTNDYGYAVNTGSVVNRTEVTTAGGLQSAINYLQRAYQNATIVGVIPPYMPGDTVKNSAGFTALDYKKTAYQIYTSNGLPVFNFTTAMGWNANNWGNHLMPWDSTLTRLHPNQASYLQMGKTIAEAFPFTTQPVWMNPTRSQTAGIIELSSGQSWKNSNIPGISWVDPFTGDVSFDLGEGITIGQKASNTIGNLKDVPSPYRPFYLSGAMFNFTTLETKPVVLGITTTGGVSIIGSMAGLTGWTVYASGTIPYCYFSI